MKNKIKSFQTNKVFQKAYLITEKIQTYIKPFLMRSENSKRAYLISVSMGVIYAIAFLSLFFQLNGLYGSDGIRSISLFIEILNQKNISAINVPSIFWLNSSDLFLHIICFAGILGSICLTLGIFPLLNAILVWFFYLSFVNVGFPFLNFQWDVLLLEAGFLLLFIIPRKKIWSYSDQVSSSKLAILAFRLLLFKLLFTSGLVKVFSGDAAWSEFTALNYHYVTQPLPHFLSWFFNLLPTWLDKLSVLFMFFIELIVPFGLFFKSKIRHFSAVLICFFMCLIMLSGNYTFFNLLVIILCLSCFSFKELKSGAKTHPKFIVSKSFVALIIIILSVSFEFNRFILKNNNDTIVSSFIRPLKLINQYGLFTIMTKKRYEIEILASLDGQNWKPYKFKSKMNHKSDIPKWVWPHQPRLDWQMWFLSLTSMENSPWSFNLVDKLFKQSRAVEGLFESVPFKTAPNYILLKKREVEFSSVNKLIKKGEWWTVGKAQDFSPIFSNRFQN